MKIIWLVNIMLPQIAQVLKKEETAYGGWLVELADAVSSVYELTVLFPHHDAHKGISGKTGRFSFYGFYENYAETKVNTKRIREFSGIVEHIQPDIIHIWGSEYIHSYEMACAAKGMAGKCVLSVQGLISVYARYYMAGLPANVQAGSTLRDLVKRDNLVKQQKKFAKRGEYERYLIKKLNYVIGRTHWDHREVMQINPNIKYFKCNELLRKSFYEGKWSYEKCRKFSIITGQGNYPIKGLHILIEALPYILKDFPDARLYVADGKKFIMSDLKQKVKADCYHLYINQLICKRRLQGKINFMNSLTEKEMYCRLKKAHVAVVPSSIENSSNFLGEAMLLGMPIVASDVGGTASMIEKGQEGLLYRWDDPVELADCICHIFREPEFAGMLSRQARIRGEENHQRDKIFEQYSDFYEMMARDVK